MMFTAVAVLLISACSVISSPIVRHKRQLDLSSQEENVNRFNVLRVKLAEQNPIANMHRLKWNDNLRSIEFECNDEFNVEKQFDKKKISGEKDPMKLVSNNTVWNCLHPIQTEIFCMEQECEGDRFPRKQCICGPHTTFSERDIKKGQPGSACNGGHTNGLCEQALEQPLSHTRSEKEDKEDERSSACNIGSLLNAIGFHFVLFFLF
ncbi:unnamed protein product [Caenorhabditis brenneri]